ncbi:TPA: LysR family transcriptional regulator, partial [Staphylococcus aureus]|nr:LysR family transcriptional regulator [Staphylococcus aureus]
MIKLNFNDLEIFITVCEEASINKAAIKLRYAQSNISQRISKLENELGVVLLFRNQKGAKATKAGEE